MNIVSVDLFVLLPVLQWTAGIVELFSFDHVKNAPTARESVIELCLCDERVLLFLTNERQLLRTNDNFVNFFDSTKLWLTKYIVNNQISEHVKT